MVCTLRAKRFHFAIAVASLSLSAPAGAQGTWQQFLPETEIITQFHGDPEAAQLRLFMAGNQFVVMDNLIAEFKKQYPGYTNIFYVTLPPGKELQWILSGGVEWNADGFPGVQELVKPDPCDKATWYMATTADKGAGFRMLQLPDVYTTVAKGHMRQLAAAHLADSYFTYTHNQLALMAHSSQVMDLRAVVEDDSIISDGVDDGKPGFNGDGELTAEGLFRILASTNVNVSEPDIKTQGIERHIWRMYTNASHAVYGCPASGHPVCGVGVNDVFPSQPDDEVGMGTFFAGESNASLRKVVYFLKRFDLGVYSDPYDAMTSVTFVHHLETPANVEAGAASGALWVGPVWGTEVEFQQFRRNNPDIVAIRVSDDAGPDGNALNRSDDVNYLAAKIGTAAKRNRQAADDFLNFLKSDEAQVIYERAGFIPATPAELSTTVPLPSNDD